MAIQTRLIEYTHDGTLLEGCLAWDDSATETRPGILVSHAWGGRNPFTTEKAKALAEQGYVAFALDLYGKGVLGTSKEENEALLQPHLDNRVRLQDRLNTCLQVLRDQSEVDAAKTAIIGYCFGGLCAMDLARSGADILGAISMHGLPFPPEVTHPIMAKMLICHGWDDPMADPESMVELAQELSEAGADWQLHAYGGRMHAFTNPEANDPDFGTVYDADADRRSWQAATNFLAEVMG
ncbi:MAG: dienelactone hydrolase family protein [Planctomycetota bacterium]|nr:dienelactone hydrolase family protein [Planctomycetota bacterium]